MPTFVVAIVIFTRTNRCPCVARCSAATVITSRSAAVVSDANANANSYSNNNSNAFAFAFAFVFVIPAYNSKSKSRSRSNNRSNNLLLLPPHYHQQQKQTAEDRSGVRGSRVNAALLSTTSEGNDNNSNSNNDHKANNAGVAIAVANNPIEIEQGAMPATIAAIFEGGGKMFDCRRRDSRCCNY